ncbi:HvfA family oxazolone/thioamide-modified RiPP metallophore [Algicola sagamiensis]|uniref:HvfA family oxazolone/thioamide-modified RiPP metallophore n=1 Tax=Algicola sagamiensis TaxID=163869 RepID=UPI0003A0319C|nr:hypothetical protein [Algicola sagamiensis]
MKTMKQTSVAAALGAVVITAAATLPVDAQANPFEMQQLTSGYQLDGGEGKCGEGKCGEKKGKKEGKCGEGKCGEKKGKKEGKCGEGKCGEKKGKKEGKCGEGKCGGAA